MRIGRKCKEWLKKGNMAIRILAVVFTIVLGFGVSFIVQATTAPRAWVASYGDGRTSGLRVSEMLEIKTSGFSSNAKLSYEYQWSDGKAGSVLGTMRSPDTAYYSYAYGDNRYLALYGSKAQKHKLTVIVIVASAFKAAFCFCPCIFLIKTANNLFKGFSSFFYGLCWH